MKRRRLTAALLAAAVLCAAALSGCAKGEKNTGGEKEITVAVNSETGTLDPAGSIALTYLSYSVTALDELLTYDENGDIEYRAAESCEVNEDSTVWTFHLREDALWSDGTPVTSEDFLNTIRRALDPASGSGYAVYLFPIENAEEIYNQEASMDTLGVDMPDDHTLVFRLEAPCVYFLDLLRLPVYTPSCAACPTAPSHWKNMYRISISCWKKMNPTGIRMQSAWTGSPTGSLTIPRLWQRPMRPAKWMWQYLFLQR